MLLACQVDGFELRQAGVRRHAAAPEQRLALEHLGGIAATQHPAGPCARARKTSVGKTWTLVNRPCVMVLAHSRSLCVVLGGTSEASDAVSTTVLQQTLTISSVHAAARESFLGQLFQLDFLLRRT